SRPGPDTGGEPSPFDEAAKEKARQKQQDQLRRRPPPEPATALGEGPGDQWWGSADQGAPPSSRMPRVGGLAIGPALVGAAVVLLGTLMAWIRVVGARSNAFDVPVNFLWDYRAAEGGLKVGLVLLALAVGAAVLTVLGGKVAVRRVLGGTVVAVAVLYTVQLQRALSAAGEGAPSLTSAIGFGVLLALGGGVAIAVDRSEPSGH
ncbi:MAG: hypothetical protein AB1673_09940, partial [Actinomycetota bacterium]